MSHWSSKCPQWKAQHMVKRHKKMYPDYVYRPSNPKHMRSDRGNEKSMKGKNVENEEPVPVTENQTSGKSHSKVDRDESNAPKEPAKSVRTMALPSPLQPVEPKVNMDSVYPGDMIKPPPGFKGAGLGGLLLKLRNDFSPPRFRVNRTLEASTRGLESRDIAQADSDICFTTTPEGDTVRYGKEAWTNELSSGST
ncbi:hypothetical protein AAF712_015087 [Marasmius tenuissimus]|uniref:Uncharacterized protein n=1 Tax=Marasmius tenuissimus TaxID=585030 RepID=A0ABR2ZBS4_9AGAR